MCEFNQDCKDAYKLIIKERNNYNVEPLETGGKEQNSRLNTIGGLAGHSRNDKQ